MTPKQCVIWSDDGFAATDGWAFAHCTDFQSGELIASTDIWVSRGCGLPVNAYLETPMPTLPGKAIVRRNEAWTQVDDHRGQKAYSITTGQSVDITEIGPLDSNLTLIAPTSPYDSWNGSSWEIDEQAEVAKKLAAAEAEQTKRFNLANQQIAIIKPAVDGGYAKPEHTQLLADWQRCRYELTQVTEQPGWPEAPQWPAEPDKVI